MYLGRSPGSAETKSWIQRPAQAKPRWREPTPSVLAETSLRSTTPWKQAAHRLRRRLRVVPQRSGSSIRGEHPARSGNHKLKRALFLSAFAALHDPTSRSYHDRKRLDGKKHNAALIYLARRRCDVLYAMLKTKEP